MLLPVSTRSSAPWLISYKQINQPAPSRENDSVRLDGCAPIPLTVNLLPNVCATPSESLTSAEQTRKYSNAKDVVTNTPITGAPIGTVMSRLARARRELHARLHAPQAATVRGAPKLGVVQ